ncbi:hypothetical protein FOZ61_006106 [Perkinsus olseni]|uniref:Uncharacterized protein n=1 Tax=Perkinsus olseni TaxID=32597 RepID=A0A7J6LQM2_PEROL|nr:hypothetical protein FOZ61_006106 [Perkinsus olseni]KAF4661612.1 hypothetical protein FOL46_005666 [Perkinsus olseni]
MTFSLKWVHSSPGPRYWLHPTKPLALHQPSPSILVLWDYCSDRYRHLRCLEVAGDVLDACFSPLERDMLYTVERAGTIRLWSIRHGRSNGTVAVRPNGHAKAPSLKLASVVCGGCSGMLHLCVVTEELQLLELSFDPRERSLVVRKCMDVWQPGGLGPSSLVCLPSTEGSTAAAAALLHGDGRAISFHAFDSSQDDAVTVTRLRPADGSVVAIARCGTGGLLALSSTGELTVLGGESIKRVPLDGARAVSLWQGANGCCAVRTTEGRIAVISPEHGPLFLDHASQSPGVAQIVATNSDVALIVHSDGLVEVVDIRTARTLASRRHTLPGWELPIVACWGDAVVCTDGTSTAVLSGVNDRGRLALGVDRGVRISTMCVAAAPTLWLGYDDGDVLSYGLEGEVWAKRGEYSCDCAPVWISVLEGAREAMLTFEDGSAGLLEESELRNLKMLQEFKFDDGRCKRVECVARPGGRNDRYCLAEMEESLVLYEVYELGRSLVYSALRKFKWAQECKWCMNNYTHTLLLLLPTDKGSSIEMVRLWGSTGRMDGGGDADNKILLPGEYPGWESLTMDERGKFLIGLSSRGGQQQCIVVCIPWGCPSAAVPTACVGLPTQGDVTSIGMCAGLLYLGCSNGRVEVWKVHGLLESGEPPQPRTADVVIAAREMGGLCRKWLPSGRRPSATLHQCGPPSMPSRLTVSSGPSSSVADRAFRSMDRLDYDDTQTMSNGSP